VGSNPTLSAISPLGKYIMRCQFEAQSYFNAYELLNNNNRVFMEQEASKKNCDVHQTLRTDIVCLAFSLELFLKDLYFVVHGKTLTGHKAHDLFAQLPEKIQEEIFSHHPENYFIAASFMYAGKTPLDKFKSKIHHYGDAFVKWRYSHEYTALDYEPSFAVDLIKAITKVANRIDQSNLNKIRPQRSAGL
jgi:hypothetical protein